MHAMSDSGLAVNSAIKSAIKVLQRGTNNILRPAEKGKEE
jgi:hypothetical protein